MKTSIDAFRRSGRWLLIFATGPSLIIAAIMVWPKNLAYAATERLVLTIIALIVAMIGLVGSIAIWRFRHDAALMLRYAKASRSLRDIVGFILTERSQSQRHRLVLIGALLISIAIWLLAHWPQLAALSSLKASGGSAAVLFAVLLVLHPIHARRSIVNTIVLQGYLRQAGAHIGFRPQSRFTRETHSEPALTITGPLQFRIGGFMWEFDDWQKNVLVVGQPGSGKSASVLTTGLDALIACGGEGQETAGLLLDPKGGYHDVLNSLCDRAGRADDLYVLSLQNWSNAPRTKRAIAYNPLDTMDDAIEVAARLVAVMKLAGGLQARDSFFIDAARAFLRHSFTLIRDAAAPEPATLLDLHRLCSENVEQSLFYNDLIEILSRKHPNLPPAEVGNAVHYFENEWRTLPDRQRSGVRSSVTQLLDDFTSEPLAQILSGRSTIKVAQILDEGKLLYLHLPLAEHERIARVLTGLIKLEFQREVLRRPRKARPSFMFADEWQTVFLAGEDKGDSDFFERSRESNHANLVAIQNLSSLSKKVTNKHEVTNFIGLNAVKIFLRNSEPETNQMASQLFGERSEVIVTASEAARLDGGWSRHQTSYNRSTRSVRVVPPDAFTELAVPVRGDPARHFAESIVHLGSRAETARLELRWPVHPLLP